MQINKSISSETQPLVKIDNVSFTYGGIPVLKNITFDVKKGDFLGLIGPNGSGKTTLLKLILGFLTPTEGHIQIFGSDLDKFNDWGKISYIPQKAGSQVFNFPVTVEEIVEMGRINKNKSRNVEDALKVAGIESLRKSQLRELSGGQAQRGFIARALVSNPELLILDEPTSGVDVDAQKDFYSLLRKLNRDFGLTLIMVSHDIDVVTNEVSVVACINGRLICHLTPKEFIKEDYLEKIYGKDMKFVAHHHNHDHA